MGSLNWLLWRPNPEAKLKTNSKQVKNVSILFSSKGICEKGRSRVHADVFTLFQFMLTQSKFKQRAVVNIKQRVLVLNQVCSTYWFCTLKRGNLSCFSDRRPPNEGRPITPLGERVRPPAATRGHWILLPPYAWLWEPTNDVAIIELIIFMLLLPLLPF